MGSEIQDYKLVNITKCFAISILILISFSKSIEMTLGSHIGKENGLKFFFKEGGGAGFHSEMRIYPQNDLATIVISNNSSLDVKSLLNSVDMHFLGIGR